MATKEERNNPRSEENSKPMESFLDFLKSFKHYLNIREGVDVNETVEAIKKDVEFKGHNIYILIFSIFIASVGLNFNSAPVIIGAMLISPLMGPIVGLGLSVGIADIALFRKSLRNISVTVIFSVLTAALYFWITPIHNQNHELLARTTPTIADALVALFGGFAGIMASSRSERGNVIPGVAIATALMPPLCTAGFGIATGNWAFFFGAFYLFVLNSLFISLATALVVRYVGFPRVSFVSKERERKVKRFIYLAVAIVLIPSGYLFYHVIKKSIFDQQALVFVEQNFNKDELIVISHEPKYNRGDSRIVVTLMGPRITADEQHEMEAKMLELGLENCRLILRQSGDYEARMDEEERQENERNLERLGTEVKTGIIQDMYEKNQQLMADQQSRIRDLEGQLHRLMGDSVPNYVLRREVHIQYPKIESSYFAVVEVNLKDGSQDTIPTVFVHWKSRTPRREKNAESEKLGQWLQVRLNMDTVRVVEY
ncbi:TIGR00341 family protein [bacterium SCSIO 12741]|nr:TIGR00341 family protein [bacterium SCSIO 12741]